jgi:hypothetical protein
MSLSPYQIQKYTQALNAAYISSTIRQALLSVLNDPSSSEEYFLSRVEYRAGNIFANAAAIAGIGADDQIHANFGSGAIYTSTPNSIGTKLATLEDSVNNCATLSDLQVLQSDINIANGSNHSVTMELNTALDGVNIALESLGTIQDSLSTFAASSSVDYITNLLTPYINNDALDLSAAQGTKGDKGDTGETGATGAQGAKGDTGETGATGPQGPAGEKGDKGDTGETGPKGDKGDTGEAPDLSLYATASDLSVVQNLLDPYIINGALTLTGGEGVGPQGAKGDTGETGATGPQGPAGEKGDKGDAGDTGPQGEKGETGATGPQGEKGDKGDAGDTGPQGPAGEVPDLSLYATASDLSVVQNLLDPYIINGALTLTGGEGLGPQGPAGEKGDKGDTGETGPKGDKGDTGEAPDLSLYATTSDLATTNTAVSSITSDLATTNTVVSGISSDLATTNTAVSSITSVLGSFTSGTIKSFYACNGDPDFGGTVIPTPVTVGANTIAGKLAAIQACSEWSFKPAQDIYGYDTSLENPECTGKLTSGDAYNLCVKIINLAPGTVNPSATSKIWSCNKDVYDSITMGDVVATGGSTFESFVNAATACANIVPMGQMGQFSRDGVDCTDHLNSGEAYSYCMAGLTFEFPEI